MRLRSCVLQPSPQGKGDREAVDKQTHGALAPMWSLMSLAAKGPLYVQ